MWRREFIALLGAAAATWPLVARAQQPALPVIGYLSSASANSANPFVAGFRRGLKEGGFIEGQNVAIEYRWAEGRYDQLPALAADLVRRQVAVIVATGGGSGLAAKAATAIIPIVFTTGGDPIKERLVTSINRPGGNATGVNLLLNAMEGKKLGLLREMVPYAKLIAVLLNPTNPSFDTQFNDTREAARSVGQQIRILNASSDSEIDAAIATAAQSNAGALLEGADTLFSSQRGHLVALIGRYAIPAIFHQRAFAEAGGLMSYGTDVPDAYRQVGIYAARILRGEKPSDLPIISSVKFQFVINLKIAKMLHVEVPPDLSARADEVIE